MIFEKELFLNWSVNLQVDQVKLKSKIPFHAGLDIPEYTGVSTFRLTGITLDRPEGLSLHCPVTQVVPLAVPATCDTIVTRGSNLNKKKMIKQFFIITLTLCITFLALDCASRNKTKQRAEHRVEECLRYVRSGDTFNLEKMLIPEQRQDRAGADFLEIVERFNPYLKEPSSDSKVHTENFVFGENEASFTLIWIIVLQKASSALKIRMGMKLKFQQGDWYIEAGKAEFM